MANMASGHRGVFRRVGKGRLPIIELFGPSVGHVFARHRPAVVELMTEAFDQRLSAELKFAETEQA
jgi:hypothetical protein